MAGGSGGRWRRGDGETRIDIRIVRDPLDFIAEEHLRQRNICAAIDRLAAQEPPERKLAADCLAHTQEELPLHVQDEDEDLFPLLRRRAEPEDDLEETLARLGEDHAIGEVLARDAVTVLSAAVRGRALSEQGRHALTAYAAHERRHLIVENAIILPLARVRLTKRDRETLALRIAARRGICLLKGALDD